MKKLIASGIILCVTGFAFAGESGIYLPDLTTVIEDNSETYIPSIDMTMSSEVELPEGTVNQVVVLPEIEVIPEPELPPPPVKNVETEGFVEAGWPGKFAGNFNLKSNSENPYNLSFVYDTMRNYAGHSQAEGFFDRNFSVSGGKIYRDEKNSFDVKGFFSDTENGLQSFGPEAVYYRSEFFACSSYTRSLPKGFELSALLESDLYKRSIESISDNTAFLIAPEMEAAWNYKNFRMALNGGYIYETAFQEHQHRGSAALDMMWKNDYVALDGKAGIVFGNCIGNNSVMVPFSVNAAVQIPVKISDKKMTFGLEGGMSSEKSRLSELEQNSPYAALNSLQKEVSDWYGIFDFYLPVKSVFDLKVNVEYRKTAFGNGTVQADYTDASIVNGLYGFGQMDRQLINSSEIMTLNLGKFNLGFGWKSFFDFVPSVEEAQLVSLTAGFESGRYEIHGNMDFPILNSDPTPVIDLEASVKVMDFIRIAVNVEDTVKLINGSSRMCAGRYSARSGCASLVIKFNY